MIRKRKEQNRKEQNKKENKQQQQQQKRRTTMNKIVKQENALLESFTRLRESRQDNEANKILTDNYVRALDKKFPNLSFQCKFTFLSKALITGANPLMDEIFLIPMGGKGVTQFSYHFLLRKAMATGKVDSFKVDCTTEDVFSPYKGKTEKQMVAEAQLLKRGSKNPIIYKARWNEFAQNNAQWKNKPCLMLEKSAIANLFRWAFPETMNGIFIQEELEPKTTSSTPTVVKNNEKDVDEFVEEFIGDGEVK